MDAVIYAAMANDGGPNAGSTAVTLAEAAAYEHAAGQTRDSRQEFDLNT
jgi:hypothetical protein